jgi:protein-S-isoprenylcysteine O-methyltransferase Ste14
MAVLYGGFVGLLAFVLGVGILGSWLRRNRSKENAENATRVMHLLFFAGLVLPATVGLFYPGIGQVDKLVGLDPLSPRLVFVIAGVVLAVPGLYFLAASNWLLRAMGKGANAFRLTKTLVEADVYEMTRNPMSLGFYLIALAVGFVSGSTLFTMGVLLGLVPAHIFFLKYFEELELKLRFGESYEEYRRKVPFIIPKFSAQ